MTCLMSRLGGRCTAWLWALPLAVGLSACAVPDGPRGAAQSPAESRGSVDRAGAASGDDVLPSLSMVFDDTNQLREAWRPVLLPRQTKPVTTFTAFRLEGQKVVKVRSTRAFGQLAHRVPAQAKQSRHLRWHWRLDLSPHGDLRTREGDDVALKVCAAFDWPLERLPALDRIRLDAARSLFGDDIPSAALCYGWHPKFAAGTVIVSPYTRRLRTVVVQGSEASLGAWYAQRRDLHADFERAFADEWKSGDMPPALLDVLIGGDADNTGAEGLGYLRGLMLSLR